MSTLPGTSPYRIEQQWLEKKPATLSFSRIRQQCPGDHYYHFLRYRVIIHDWTAVFNSCRYARYTIVALSLLAGGCASISST